jgi:hypothetical protein
MKRCLLLLSLTLLMGAVVHAQLVNNGATITVQSGATIKCTGAIVNNSGGIIQNAGIVSSDGELRNQSGGTLSNNGTAGVYEATTKFVNNGNAFSAIRLRLIGSANTDSIKSGAGSTYDSVILAKGAGFTATLSDAMTVNGGIRFGNDNNQLSIEDENLVMGTSATFQNADNNQFVITNNTGTVTKQSLGTTAFSYPVGFSAAEYNPVTIANSGTVDNISVRCLQNVLNNGLTGSPVTADFANNGWVVTEGVAGGSNFDMTTTWAASDELSNFNRQKVGIARYNTGTDWDLPASNVVAASGTGPYTRNRTGITSTGVFAVADLQQVNAVKLNLKVFLAGSYTGAGLMKDALRVANLIPITQPYDAALNAKFTRVGIYDGSLSVNETVPSTAVFDVAGTNDDIVDWVYLSLQDGSNPATKLQTRAALVQRDGDVVEYDVVSGTYVPVKMPIDVDGNYYLVVSHRNHLSVRTALSQLLQDNATFTYDFTDAQSKAFQNGTVTTNAAMKDLGSGVFGLWAGNANSNTTVRYAGPGNDPASILLFLGSSIGGIVNNVYSTNDVNMDGTVRYAGPGNDPGFLLSNTLGGLIGFILGEH